jgi:hypothetical protein
MVTLSLDCWKDGKDIGEIVERPSLSQVMGAISLLDGEVRTLVTLGDSDEYYIMIAGPYLGEYLVNATLDNKNFFSLRKSESSGKKVLCYVGGQDGEYDVNQFVPREQVERAATFFFESHNLSPDLKWFKD